MHTKYLTNMLRTKPSRQVHQVNTKEKQEDCRLNIDMPSEFQHFTSLIFGKQVLTIYCQPKLRYHSDHRFNIQAMKGNHIWKGRCYEL